MAGRITKGKAPAPRKQRVSFKLADPEAQVVQVAGSFCDWQPQTHPMKRDRHGVWKVAISLLPGRYEYRFVVDGAWRDDPDCSERAPNSFGTTNSIVEVLPDNVQALHEVADVAHPV